MRAILVASALSFTAACAGAAEETPGASPGPPAPAAAVTTSPTPGAPSAVDASAVFQDAAVPPRATCDVRSYGAAGDGRTKDTAAIQRAIDACAGPGGGTVFLHAPGTYLSGMIRLKSAVALHVDPGATLKGTQDDADYPTTSPPTNNTQLLNCRKALVYAESAHDVRIEGGGTIDGNGDTPKWIGPSEVHPERTRPMAIYTALSRGVTIEDITMRNAAMWGIVNLETDDLVIRRVTIDTPLSGNRDGIDIVDCHHVLVEDCTIRSEDDSICLKSGAKRGVEDVLVRNCKVKQSIVANALKMGTASYGAFRDITFDGISVDSADKAAMAVESVDGAEIANVTFRNITAKDVGSPMFVILGDRGTTPLGEPRRVGSIDGVRFERVTVASTRHDWGSPISGTVTPDGVVHRIENLAFDRVNVTVRGGLGAVPADPPEYAGQYPDPNLWGNLPGFAYYFRHVDGVTFTASTTKASANDKRAWMVQRDVTRLTLP